MGNKYLFTSERLGFRNWKDADIPKMISISGDKDVMEFFPAPATPIQTEEFIGRMQTMFSEKGYCYFAVERLEDAAFIGFIGLMYQTYDVPFSPYTDIGWRLGKEFWNKGYATEGASRCLKYAFEDLDLSNIKATAPLVNVKSIRVMEKIGMKKQLEFKHPRLVGNTKLETCTCYQIER